jgi:asparagine synthase (glutamine-hydrolysing)
MLARYGKRKYASLLEYGGNFAQAYLLCRAFHLPWELTRILDPDLVSEGLDRLSIIGRLHDVERRLKSPRAKIAGMEMQFYMRSQLLRDTDWAGMAHSLEIRVPFVDLDMLRTIARLIVAPRMLSKSDFIDGLLADLPPSINRRAKTGFSTPVKSWLASGDTADDLRKWGREVRESFKSYHSTLKPA